jgi:hypothetical protein
MSQAIAAVPEASPSATVERSVQASITATADPRVRLTRFAPDRRWGLQASVQVYRQDGEDWRVTPWPLLTDGGVWVAPRIGLLWHTHLGGDRFQLELGLAIDPLTFVEGAVMGGRLDTPLLGVTFLSLMGAYHSIEYTSALTFDVTPRVSVWGGFLVSATSIWWNEGNLLDEQELSEQETLLLLQPSVGMCLRF